MYYNTSDCSGPGQDRTHTEEVAGILATTVCDEAPGNIVRMTQYANENCSSSDNNNEADSSRDMMPMDSGACVDMTNDDGQTDMSLLSRCSVIDGARVVEVGMFAVEWGTFVEEGWYHISPGFHEKSEVLACAPLVRPELLTLPFTFRAMSASITRPLPAPLVEPPRSFKTAMAPAEPEMLNPRAA